MQAKLYMCLISTLCLCTLCSPAWAEEPSQWGNAAPVQENNYLIPGQSTVVILPDGTQLPATVQTNGLITLPDGTVLNQPDATVRLPNGEQIKLGDVHQHVNVTTAPENQTILPKTPEKPVAPVTDVTPKAPITPKKPQSDTNKQSHIPNNTQLNTKTPNAPATQAQPLQLWQMLPLTNVPKGQQTTLAEQSTPTKPAQHNKPDIKQQKQTPPQAPKTARAKIGENLKIPPEAIKTGNLDFLEGCWQGTRPEYFSKRTIQECFCFGAHGGNGKRHIIDKRNKVQCTGDTKARLDGNGILRVTSNGAACDNGERWGAAQMTCRGQGQKTPCSWIFTDTNGGKQSYQIPFVRVKSCGRP